MNIENCLEYFMQATLKNEAQKNASYQKTNTLSSPSQKLLSDDLQSDEMEFSPVNSIFRNPSNFEYDPNKSLRMNLAK